MDKDGGGSLSHDELAEVIKRFRRFGFKASDKEINALMKYLDVDGNGSIDFDEFVAMVAPSHVQPVPKRPNIPHGSNQSPARHRHIDFAPLQPGSARSGGPMSYRQKFREESSWDDSGTPRAQKWVPAHWLPKHSKLQVFDPSKGHRV